MLKNHVVFILDRSSSMESIRDATIKAFNDQVSAIREHSRGQLTDVSLFTFSSTPDAPTFFTAPVESLVTLNRDTFVPSGMTALYDTVLEATRQLTTLPDANDKDTSYLVVCLSDGDENSSHASGTEVSKRLEALQATGRWTFTYLGCSAGDLTKMRAMGISAGNSRGFSYSAAGVESTSALNCAATSNYFTARSTGSSSVNNLYDQAEAQLGTFPSVQVNTPITVTQGPANLIINPMTNTVVSAWMPTDVKTPDKVDEKTPPTTT